MGNRNFKSVFFDRRGFGLLELLLAGSFAASTFVFLTAGMNVFDSVKNRNQDKQNSRLHTIYSVMLFQNVGRYASACTNDRVNFRSLNCDVDFGAGVEKVQIAFDPDIGNVTYRRGPTVDSMKVLWTAPYVESFYVCSGEDIVGIGGVVCPDGSTPWAGTTYAATPGDIKNYFRIKMTSQLAYYKWGIPQFDGSTYTAESAFFSRNAGTSTQNRYVWAPLGGS